MYNMRLHTYVQHEVLYVQYLAMNVHGTGNPQELSNPL